METITFKAPDGTRAGLRRVNANISALLRETSEQLIQKNTPDSALAKVKHLAGKFAGPKNLSYSQDYLKQYAQKNHR